MASVESLTTVQKFYISYYQRPGDPAGMVYWANRLEAPGGSLQELQAAFGNSPESLALYGPINSTTIGDVIDEIYMGLFGRLPDPAGKAFYEAGFNNGTFSPAGIAYSIYVGAQGNDALILQNKLQAANEFTQIVDGRDFADPSFGQGPFYNATYAGSADADAARAWLGAIDASPTTVPSVSQTTAFIQNAIASPTDPINGFIGTPHTLTVNTDVIQITNPGSVDTVLGVVATTNPTFSIGDLILGNNQTTLQLAVVDSGLAALATLSNIKAVNILAGTGGFATFEAIQWTNVGSVNLIGGTPGLFVEVDHIGPMTGFSISGATSGSIELDYNNGINVYGSSEAGGGLTWDPVTGSVIGTAGPGGDVYFSAWATTSAGDLHIGNVSLLGNQSDFGSFEAFHTRTGPGGNVTVGDVTIKGFNDIYVDISNSDYTSDSYDLTVGNITVQTRGGSADAEVYINQENYQSDGVPAGDLTVGNLVGSVGKSGDLSFTLYDTGYGAGNLKIGDITQTVGQNGYAYLYIDHSGEYSKAGDNINVGTTDIGNIAVNVGVGGSGYADIYNWVSASGATAELGQVKVGNIDLNLGVTASYTFYFSVSAEAFGGGVSIIDGVERGNFTANVNDGGDLYGYDLYVWNSSTNGVIGDIKLGDLTVNAGVSASVTLYADVTARGTDSSIGNVSSGDVTINTNTGAYVYVSEYLWASNGDIGDVSVGNVSVNAVTSATAYYDLYEYGNNVGDWDIGNVNITALGPNAYASVYLSWTATGSMGPSDVGDVTMNVKGQSATGYFSFYQSAGSAGPSTFGDFDLSIGNSAKKTGAYLDVYISTTSSDVVVGDIALHGTSVRGTTDATMTYQAYFSVYASNGHDIDVGNIKVTGGDGKADNFATLTGWLTLSTTGSVTIGDVDYSGYGAKATIDVSTFKGAEHIIGSGKADTITDNKGTNTITGGGGADTFNFVTTNTGKTLATMDKITDFNEGAGDLVTASFAVAPTPANYGEASYADFASFVSGANAGNKEIWVGNVTGTGLIAAIDYNNDGTVDYMIQFVGLNNLNQIDVNAFG